MQNQHGLVKVDWQTNDEAHSGWAEIYRAVDVVQSLVYDVFPGSTNSFGADLDKSPARRLLWSQSLSWLEMRCDPDDALHLECLQYDDSKMQGLDASFLTCVWQTPNQSCGLTVKGNRFFTT